MYKYLAAVAAILTAAALIVVTLTLRNSFDPVSRQARADAARYDTQRRALELERQRWELEQAQQHAAAVAPVVTLAGALWTLAPLVIIGAVVYILADMYRLRRRPVVRADARGLYPLDRRRLQAGHYDAVIEGAAAGYHLTQATAARHQPLGERVTVTIKPDRGAPAFLGQPNEPTSLREAAPVPTPTMAELIADGRVGPGRPLLFGFHDGQPVTGSMKQLYSGGIGGLQGTGKTWTAAYLLALSALDGARLIVCDPHAGDDESLAIRTLPLAPAFLCDVADDERTIVQALRLAEQHYQRRKTGDPDRTPIIVAIDEWTALRRGQAADLLPPFVETFSTEGRKLNCHVLLLGQRWDKESIGSFRNTLASSWIHRMRADEARMMTGLRAGALPADTLQLPPGSCYLVDTVGSLTRLDIPYTTARDMQTVGAMLQAPTPAASGRFMGGFQAGSDARTIHRLETGNKPGGETGNSAVGCAELLDPQAAQILGLFYESGYSIGGIVKELWPKAESGTPYNQKREYVEQVLRNARAGL